MTHRIMLQERDAEGQKGRRRFLKGAGLAGIAGAATIAMPNVSRAETATLKMQGAWGAQDIFNEMAVEYVDRVNKMAGNRLKIEYLISGSVVKAFSLQDAVSDGVLDAGHWVAAYWYGKHKAASFFGTSPCWGWTANQGLAWIHKGGGKELYADLMRDVLGLNIVGFFAMPMPTQPLGWFKKPVKTVDDLQGLKYRTVGLAADVMQQMGMAVAQLPGGEILPAMERGVIDAFEYNNPTSDRRFGAQDVAKNYMMSSYHQATEYFEIMFNKDRFEALPDEHKAIIEHAAEAASTANMATAYDNYSSDLQWLKTDGGVDVQRTSQDILDAQLKAWDVVMEGLVQDPVIAKIVESQKAWAKRVAYYELYNSGDYKLAYQHYFGDLGF